jgi:transcriptional regulator with XRE-family HTH domain
MDLNELGYIVRLSRQTKGLTQTKLAMDAHTQPSVISNFERGAIMPSKKVRAYIQKILGIPPEMLSETTTVAQVQETLSKCSDISEDIKSALSVLIAANSRSRKEH